MKILAIDQATVTGFAVVHSDGLVMESGTWDLSDKKRSGESRGMRYIRFRTKLGAILDAHPDVELVVHEQTLLRGGAATEIAMGFKALLLEATAARGIEVTSVHTTELKKFATGSGKAEKPAMIVAAKSLSGVSPRDDNEADAILIGLWASSIYGAFPAPEWASTKKPRPKGRARLIGIDDV